MKTVVVYGSTMGATEGVALDVGSAFADSKVLAVGDVSAEDLQGIDLLILGASTWGMGDLQDDMAAFLDTFSGWDVTVPFGAVFGTGDQFTYADTFVDGIADMADALKNKGVRVVGFWPAEGYDHSASRAQQGDAFFGLALDQDNEPEKTADRLAVWVKQLLAECGA